MVNRLYYFTYGSKYYMSLDIDGTFQRFIENYPKIEITRRQMQKAMNIDGSLLERIVGRLLKCSEENKIICW